MLELSAQKNNPLANDLLGEIYNETITIKGDIKKALSNYGGDRKKSIEHSKIAAKKGIFSSQSRLAYFHYTNALLAKSNNYVEALKWMNIVASQKPGEMNTLRHQLLKEMPPEDIKQAEKLADICLHTNFKDCD